MENLESYSYFSMIDEKPTLQMEALKPKPNSAHLALNYKSEDPSTNLMSNPASPMNNYTEDLESFFQDQEDLSQLNKRDQYEELKYLFEEAPNKENSFSLEIQEFNRIQRGEKVKVTIDGKRVDSNESMKPHWHEFTQNNDGLL